MASKTMTTDEQKEQWQNKFLNAGTEKGLGDLSMMIGVVSEILESHKEKLRSVLKEMKENEVSALALEVNHPARIRKQERNQTLKEIQDKLLE